MAKTSDSGKKVVPSFDYLVRATDEGGRVRVLAARTTHLVEDARSRHGTYPTVTAALGRVLTASALMGAVLKGNETVTLRVLGNGPAGGIVADANARGEVRGYAKNPHVHVPLNPWEKFDVAEVVGKEGTLYVTYDLELKGPYTSNAPLVSGEIAKDLVYYYYASEQVPSAVALGVLVGWDRVMASGGLILQLLPGADRSLIPVLEKNAAGLSDVSHLIHEGKTPEDLVDMALGELKARALGKLSLHFKCRCSKEKLKDILVALGEEQIRDLRDREGKAEAICHFCNHKYLLSKPEVEALLARIKKGKSA